MFPNKLNSGKTYCTGCGASSPTIHGYDCPFDPTNKKASMVKSVDTTDLKSVEETHAGSIPAAGTIKLRVKPRIRKVGKYWFCVSLPPNFNTGIGTTPKLAYIDWQYS